MTFWQKLLTAAIVVFALYLVARMVVARIQPVPGDLGAQGGSLRPCPDMPNCACSQSTDERHQVEPLALTMPHRDALAGLVSLLKAMPRTTIETATDDYIHATVTSAGFGYIDDIELLIQDDQIDIRSGARLGYYDFEHNHKRVEAIRQAWAALSE